MKGVKERMAEKEKEFENQQLRKAVFVLILRVAVTIALFLGIVSLIN